MGEIIKLKSRNNETSLIQLHPLNTDKESKTYKLVTNAEYMRCGYTDNGLMFIDPPGGPFLQVGESINNRVIKSIDHSYEVGYLITFE